ncbi:MAG: hypothetical protein ACKVQV_06140, partial [Bacteroidia bacterium]
NVQFDLINETLMLQTFGFSKSNILTSSNYCSDDVKKYIYIVLQSKYIANEEMPVSTESIIICDNEYKYYTIPIILIKTVLLHILTNLKKYTKKLSDKYSIKLEFLQDSISFTFTNEIDYDSIINDRQGRGNEMCKDIVDVINSHYDLQKLKISKIDYSFDPRPSTKESLNKYNTSLIINYI